jgi:hypothetical protein
VASSSPVGGWRRRERVGGRVGPAMVGYEVDVERHVVELSE